MKSGEVVGTPANLLIVETRKNRCPVAVIIVEATIPPPLVKSDRSSTAPIPLLTEPQRRNSLTPFAQNSLFVVLMASKGISDEYA